MDKLYLILHEQYVKNTSTSNENTDTSKSADQCLSRIDEIMNSERYMEIRDDMPAGDPILAFLPSPDEVELIIIGGAKWKCCTAQLYSARKAGYTASLDEKCLDDGTYINIRPKDLLHFVPEIVPFLQSKDPQLLAWFRS